MNKSPLFGSKLLGKDEFLWLSATALLLVMVPFSVYLFGNRKKVEVNQVAASGSVCGNGICEEGEASRTICPPCDPSGPCPMRPCYIIEGYCPSDCESTDNCIQSGGYWREPDVACTQVLTDGCDCGPVKCWDGTSCVPNPYPKTTITPMPTIDVTVFNTPTPYYTPFPTAGVTKSPCAVTPPPFRVGDTDGDGDVDGYDYVVWFTNFGKTTSQAARFGDFNNDCHVDGYDFVLWWQNFGK